MLDREATASAPEAGHHFVGDQQDVVLVQISRILGQYSLTGGTTPPDDPIIGSAINAAIESAPCLRISFSSAVAHSISQEG